MNIISKFFRRNKPEIRTILPKDFIVNTLQLCVQLSAGEISRIPDNARIIHFDFTGILLSLDYINDKNEIEELLISPRNNTIWSDTSSSTKQSNLKAEEVLLLRKLCKIRKIYY